MQETQIRSLVQEDPLEKEVATLCSILAWRISWTEEPGRLQSVGSQRVGHNWTSNTRQQLKIWWQHEDERVNQIIQIYSIRKDKVFWVFCFPVFLGWRFHNFKPIVLNFLKDLWTMSFLNSGNMHVYTYINNTYYWQNN